MREWGLISMFPFEEKSLPNKFETFLEAVPKARDSLSSQKVGNMIQLRNEK